MGYCSSPKTREEIASVVSHYFDGGTSEHLADVPAETIAVLRARALLFIDGLPDVVEKKKTLALYFRHWAKKHNVFLEVSDETALPVESIEEIRDGVCAEMNVFFYREHVDDFVERLLLPYVETNDPPDSWYISSFGGWFPNDGAGKKFSRFWQKMIGFGNQKAIDELILAKLPENWRQAFKVRECGRVCEHKWLEMDPKDIVAVLVPLKKRRDPSKYQWGLGSIFYWGEDVGYVGRSFYSAWRMRVEKQGDEAFRDRILPHFPEELQETYQLQEEANCLQKWGEMSPQEIVGVLMGLSKKLDPSTNRWGLGAVASCWRERSEKGDLMIGKSFWSYWRNNIEKTGDEKFRETLLPHFPEEWQKNYLMIQDVCPYKWGEMKGKEIAKVLQGLRKPKVKTKWGLGSVMGWYGPNGEKWGQKFVVYWRTYVENEGDEKFRKLVLPHMGRALSECYKMVGFVHELRDHRLFDKIESDGTYDLDDLFVLVEKGNRYAFDKLHYCLRNMLELHFPELIIDDHKIDRMIHAHLSVFGSIKSYAISCARKHLAGEYTGDRRVRNLIEEMEASNTGKS